MRRAPFVVLSTLWLGCGADPPVGGDAAAGADAAPPTDLPGMEVAQEGPQAIDSPLPAELRQLIQHHVERKDFMGVILAARGERILFQETHGLANQEWQIPHTVQGKFRIGSVSKQFTAALALLFEQQGRWSLGDPVKKHLPEAPAAWDGITLHHLLSHTSGIPDLVRDPGYEANIPLPSPPEMSYLMFRDRPLSFAPGERYEYSNSGYILLALLVERLTGEKFHDVLRARVLEPLGLHDTGGDAQRTILARRVAGYGHVPGQPGTHRNGAFIDMSRPTGAGSLYSTSGDLLRWQRALYGGRLLAPTALEKMTRAQVPIFSNNSYGYGLFVGTYLGSRLRFAHPGNIHGFHSLLVYYPETEVTVVVLSNVGVGRPADEIALRLAEWVHGDPPFPFPTGPPPPRPDGSAADAGAPDTADGPAGD